MTRAAKDIASDISKAFGGEFKVNGKTYTMKTDVQITAVTSMDDVSSSDHLFVLSDRIESADIAGRAATNEIGGKVMSVWSGDFADNDWLGNNLSYNNIFWEVGKERIEYIKLCVIIIIDKILAMNAYL